DVDEDHLGRDEGAVDGLRKEEPGDGRQDHPDDFVGDEAAQRRPGGLTRRRVLGLSGEDLESGGRKKADEPGDESESVQEFPGDHVPSGPETIPDARRGSRIQRSARAPASGRRSVATRASLSRRAERWIPVTGRFLILEWR